MILDIALRDWVNTFKIFARQIPIDMSDVGSSRLTPAAVGGITAGGVVGLFLVLILIARFTAQKRHGGEKESRRMSTFSVDDDVRRAVTSAHPPQLDLSFEPPYTQYPSRKPPTVTDVSVEDDSSRPERSTSKLSRRSKALFRYSRDSWPLITWAKSPTTPVASSITHPSTYAIGESIIRPSSSPTVQNVLEIPAPPVRSYSQPGMSTEMSVGFENGSLANTMGRVGRESMRPTLLKQRSFSNNHLTSILQSTSQRLRDPENTKAGRPLSRAMSSLSQSSGAPPPHKLPSPPRTKNTESREGLIAEYIKNRPGSAASNAESTKSSLFDMFPSDRTPSSEKQVPWPTDDVQERPLSPAQSEVSDDSLYRGKTPESLPVIAPLTSPNKKTPSPQKPRSHSLKEEVTLMHKDNRASIVATGGRNNFAHRRTVSRASTDPFYSNPTNLTGPREISRPNYYRKATFGEAKLPLSSVSGNNVPYPSGFQEKPTQANPFRWSPEDTCRQKFPQVIPKQSVRRGHKRQNVVRMSGLPRPLSVNMIPEQPEEVTPDRLVESTSDLAPPSTTFSNYADSPTSVYSRFTVTRPPSIQEFDPTVSLPDLTPKPCHTADFPLPPYSSTLSIYNYYSSPEGVKSEEDLIAETPSRTASQARRRHGRDFSNDQNVNGFAFSPCTKENQSLTSNSTSFYSNARSHESIQASIGILRRMNSEISTCSLASSRASEIDMAPFGAMFPPIKKNRASQYYLSIGAAAGKRSKTPSPIRKRARDTNHSDLDESPSKHSSKGGIRRSDSSLGSNLQRNNSTSGNTISRDSSLGHSLNRNSGLRIHGVDGLPEIPPKDKRRSLRSEETTELLRQYTRSRSGGQEGWETPAIDKGTWDGSVQEQEAQKVQIDWERTQRAEHQCVRHESQLKMPSPRTTVRWNGMQDFAMGINTRESLGLYDEDGFLRSSPMRESRI